MSNVGHVSPGKQIIDNPTPLRVQKVHNVLDWRTIGYNKNIAQLIIR